MEDPILGDGHEYWERQKSPGHRYSTAAYYEEHAADLRLLFAKQAPREVLELCCGSGALYPYLGFTDAQYTGVDFSSSMLSEFEKSHPGLNLKQGDVTNYADGKQYDLILMEFSAAAFQAWAVSADLQECSRHDAPAIIVCLFNCSLETTALGLLWKDSVVSVQHQANAAFDAADEGAIGHPRSNWLLVQPG